MACNADLQSEQFCCPPEQLGTAEQTVELLVIWNAGTAIAVNGVYDISYKHGFLLLCFVLPELLLFLANS